MTNYEGREQTRAKHVVLEKYLQALAYKILQGTNLELAYVDAFSGPWEARDQNFADTSFMTAIKVLHEIHSSLRARRSNLRTSCLFIEKKLTSYTRLSAAISEYHRPDEGFYVSAHHGAFEASCAKILDAIAGKFALTFIDPTGWTGYSYDVIAPVLKYRPGEVLINFMYDYINRAAGMSDPRTVASLDPILGGPGWKDRLAPGPTGPAVEELFKNELRKAGSFTYVVSTHIRKTLSDRPYFSLAYATRNEHGLKAFRQAEYDAQRIHAPLRAAAKQKHKEIATGQTSLFAARDNFDGELALVKDEVGQWILEYAAGRHRVPFRALCPMVLSKFSIRETDLKAVCVSLAKQGKIDATWKQRSRLARGPDDTDDIRIAAKTMD